MVNSFASLLTDQDLPRAYLIKASSWSPGAAAVVQTYLSTDARTPLYDGHLWAARLTSVVDINASLGSLHDPRGTMVSGGVSIAMGDGGLDLLRDYYSDGHPLIIYMGDPTGAFTDFGVILQGQIASSLWTEKLMRLVLRDARWPLQKNIQTTAYAGTGGAEGGADLKNVLKPLGFGVVHNAEPVMVDQTNLVMQVHERLVNSFAAVYDQGVVLTLDGADVADYAALLAWTPVAGKWKACKACGMIRLGAIPVGPVTVDFTGDATGSYVSGGAEIIKRIAEWKAPSITIDTTAFSDAQTARPWNCGLYLRDGGGSIQDAMDRLGRSIGAWTDMATDGKLTIGIVDFDTPVLTIDETDYAEFQAIETPVPPSKVRIGYQRSWLVQKLEESIGTAARKAFTEVDLRWESATGVSTSAYPTAAELTVETLLDVTANAQSLAAAKVALYAAGRRLYTCRAFKIQHRLKRGDTITLKHVQFIPAGKDFIVWNIIERVGDGDRETILTLFG